MDIQFWNRCNSNYKYTHKFKLTLSKQLVYDQQYLHRAQIKQIKQITHTYTNLYNIKESDDNWEKGKKLRRRRRKKKD